MVVIEHPTKPCTKLSKFGVVTCTKLETWTKTDADCDYVSFTWIGLLINWSTVQSLSGTYQCGTGKTKHWQLYLMVVVGKNHSLQISTRTLSKAWPLTAVCWCVLGGRGGGVTSSWFVLGGHGGGASFSLCCGSLLSSSLGDSRVSSAENCCGGIGGGGEPSVSSGVWGRDVVSTLMEEVPGRIGWAHSRILRHDNFVWNRDIIVMHQCCMKVTSWLQCEATSSLHFLLRYIFRTRIEWIGLWYPQWIGSLKYTKVVFGHFSTLRQRLWKWRSVKMMLTLRESSCS